MKALGFNFQPVESTYPFKVLVSDVNLHPYSEAWKNSIEVSKAGLQATLLVRHPDDGRLLVNFDKDIVQLIREVGRCKLTLD